jgi:nucleotidyltransferase substrate binding protein (TIGR01987 family)
MNETNYIKLQKSLKRLEERHNDFLEIENRPELSSSDIESIQESCIQRFEFCFDMLWKHLKKYLKDFTGLPEIPNSPRPIFRIALDNKVIEDFETWDNYNQKRNDTSHDYSEAKASETIHVIPSFIQDAIKLYEIMTKEKWI